MNLFLVFVTDDKALGFYKIKQGRQPLTSDQKKLTAKTLVGSRPYLYLLADDKLEIEDKLIEFGFPSKIEFINNYSKLI